MSKLEDLAKKYGTDKLGHGYIPYYEKHLPENPERMLEIGIAKGASALMWKEFYPDTEIHYLDLFMDEDHVTEEWGKENGFVTHKGSQSDPEVLAALTLEPKVNLISEEENSILLSTTWNKFDVVIDDGSHNAYDMWISFVSIAHFMMNRGSVYIIEDLHCCLDQFYWDGDKVSSFEDTPLYHFQKGEILDNKCISKETAALLNSKITDIHLYDDKIAFIQC